MEILQRRPASGSGNEIAYLDVRFDNGVIARNLKLVRTRAGYRLFGPTLRDQMIVAIPAALADIIIREAVAYEPDAA